MRTSFYHTDHNFLFSKEPSSEKAKLEATLDLANVIDWRAKISGIRNNLNLEPRKRNLKALRERKAFVKSIRERIDE